MNFTILPKDLQLPKPEKFKLPKLSRKKQGRLYKWSAEPDDSDSDDDSDSESATPANKVVTRRHVGMYD